MFIGGLQRVIVAGSIRSLISRVAREAGVGNIVLWIGSGRQNLSVGIVVPEVIEMGALGYDIACLDRIVRRNQVLNGQIVGLDVRRLEIVLASIQVQSHSAADRRILEIVLGKRLLHRRRLSVGEQQRVLRVGAGEGLGIDKRIIGAERAAIAKVAKRSVGCSVAATNT